MAMGAPPPCRLSPSEARVIELLDAPLQILDRPFGTDRRELDVQAGLTIQQLLDVAGIPPGTPVRVYLDGDLIYPEFYHVVRPKRGAHVLVRVVPRGGGGGGGRGKSIGMIVAGVLLIVAGIAASAFGYTAGLAPFAIKLGVGLLISGIINILIPAPTDPKLKPLAGIHSNQEPESPTLSISGQTNA